MTDCKEQRCDSNPSNRWCLVFMTYPHFRVHSDYTLASGVSKPAALAERGAELDMPAMALTDTMALFGAMDITKATTKVGMQPVIGMEALLSPEAGAAPCGNILLLACSELGYINLCHILRDSYQLVDTPQGPAFPKQIVVTLANLASNSADIIALTGNADAGALPSVFTKRGVQAADNLLAELRKVFGDRLYLEICRNRPPQDYCHPSEAYLRAKSEDGLPLVATTEVWYAHKEAHRGFEMMRAVRTSTTLSVADGKSKLDTGVRYHLRSRDEMDSLFADLPQALANTFQVAKRSAFMPRGRAPILPPFKSQSGLSEAEELRRLAHLGLTRRLEQDKIVDDEEALYRQRLDFELDVIIKMNFPGYFLIVSDFITWAKEQGIPVGPGRGSGAGSLVAYSLLITNVNPLPFGLLFERFLNPDRVSMPDFDIDFCIDRRQEVINYVRQKYGDDHVSMIVTFGGIKAKTAIRDTTRILADENIGHVSFRDMTGVLSLLPTSPSEASKTLSVCEQDYPELADHLREDPKARGLYDYAKRIEGLYRQSGTHAAGVIIGDRPLYQLFPVIRDENTGMPTAAFSQKPVEAVGAVKFDFLGLKNLTIIRLATDYIRETKGVEVDIDQISLKDDKVYLALSRGLTSGVFQLSGMGMRKALIQIKPTGIEDITAINALYRPGPMRYIESYAKRKAGDEPVVYPGPVEKTRPVLEETFGYMVYQEQVMQVAQVCAGYSLGAADLLRRAMGKKIASEMAAQKTIFIHGNDSVPGAVKLGMSERAATALFEDIERFADYGFNKSHAVAYALIAYQTMWLKVNYPAEFYAALMSYNIDKPEVLDEIKAEMAGFGVDLLLPDINLSGMAFRPEMGPDNKLAVRFGLSGIKNISTDRKAFVAERDRNGGFTSLHNFIERTRHMLNSAAIEKLVEAGCFDALALQDGRASPSSAEGALSEDNNTANRGRTSAILKWLYSHQQSGQDGRQNSLFGESLPIQIPQTNDKGAPVATAHEWGDRALREHNSVGFWFSEHPVNSYRPVFIKAGVKRRLSYESWMRTHQQGQLHGRLLCVMVDDIDYATTRKGKPFIRAKVSEPNDRYSVTFFEPWASQKDNVDSLLWVKTCLENAKSAGAPVVIGADLTSGGSFGPDVKGSFVETAQTALSDIHADYILTLSSEERHPIDSIRDNLTALCRRYASQRDDASVITLCDPDGRVLFSLPGRYHSKCVQGISQGLRLRSVKTVVPEAHSPEQDEDNSGSDAGLASLPLELDEDDMFMED